MIRDVRRWTSPVVAGVLATASVALVNPLTSGDAGPGAGGHPVVRNVIFINGDGMAAAHREAARLYYAGLGGQLVMDGFPVSGQLTTSPDDPEDVVTDSAAGASAWATGVATYNGAISVDTAGNPLPTLGAQAKAAGKATGLVTTAQVTDASPAAFFSNAVDRAAQDDIARQYLQVSKPDVILGGGEDWWLPAGSPGAYPDQPPEDPTEGSRGTKGDLIAQARADGYRYVSTPAQLAAAGRGKLLGLFANQEMFQQRPEGQGDVYAPVVDLATMARKALATLSADRDGFFLLIEEEGVDEFAHNNNGSRTLQAMGELEKAVAVAKQFAATHRDTLVVVTGDHETGGLAVEDVNAADESGTGTSAEDGPFPVRGSDKSFVIDWTTTAHTGQDVPVTAYGPLAGRFTGKHPNTYVYDVLQPLLTR
ncbi:alkaline phosphatase [Actinoplanes octamycinicus]|uniref:Alkaline phosphatase n=1 Tax=Actinoplanes octamycinicus TaxID=135948 RepID=A0A7W7H0D4_9ACTN|nr:alkaline phosphatase [Actinoplanes octamycinicus]MBB4741598.1 alkaline phosphatase [Actinoplanes octamycinicus]GIE57150.1 alkaline phosphatase [Actinoplanes octamycinicus]